MGGFESVTTDGNRVYLTAVEDAFGSEIDYAMLVKLYGPKPGGETRYSPAQCIGCEKKSIPGNPDEEHVSTSYVERQNLYENGDASVHSAHKRVLKEDREPCRIDRAVLHVVQLWTKVSDSSERRQP